jgi:mannose-1-phosphate guanylyltransferase
MPKQLLPLGAGGETLLAAAARRASAARDLNGQTLIVTASAFLAASQRAVPSAQFIAEPCARNTAAALGLAATVLLAQDSDAILIATPADQYIADEALFVSLLALASQEVEQRDVICTLGIVPSRAETGFGYLETGERLTVTAPSVMAVRRFVEKPSLKIATEYLHGGKHLWNAGIFVVRASRLLAEIAQHLPEIATGLATLGSAFLDGESAFADSLAAIFPTLPSVSIDHGVMEKVTNVVTIAADVGWDDIGSWASVPTILGQDASGNSCAGSVIAIDAHHNVVVAERGIITIVGVDNLAVVRRGDAVLVMPLTRAQDVKLVHEQLLARGLTKYL